MLIISTFCCACAPIHLLERCPLFCIFLLQLVPYSLYMPNVFVIICRVRHVLLYSIYMLYCEVFILHWNDINGRENVQQNVCSSSLTDWRRRELAGAGAEDQWCGHFDAFLLLEGRNEECVAEPTTTRAVLLPRLTQTELETQKPQASLAPWRAWA